MNLGRAASEVAKEIPQGLARDLLLGLSKLNRLQGSLGLVDAVRELKELIEGVGEPAKIVEVPHGAKKGFIEVPVGWDPLEASLVIKVEGRTIFSSSLIDHPTLLSAHSPEGEGCGEIKVCDRPCEGEVVLTKLNPYDAYNVVDARLILHYDPRRFRSAVPYTGLFLSEREIRHGKVVMNLPYDVAAELLSRLMQKPGSKAEACWKARVSYNARSLPVLVSCEEGTRVMIVSHVCHPKPGAHDNASGSVANFLALFAKKRVVKGGGICHAWVPEYSGTVFLDGLVDNKTKVINLDMVGSKQHITGSVLSIVNAPLFFPNRASAALYLAARAVLDTIPSFEGAPMPSIRYDVSPYSSGSDHDVFLAWGIDAGMLNEWPSKYYHTDMDSPDTLSLGNLARAAAIAVLAGSLLLDEATADKIADIYKSYLGDWYRTKATILGLEAPSARAAEKTEAIKPAIPSPISSRFIYKRIGREAFYEAREIRGAFTYLSVYAPISERLGIANHMERFVREELLDWTGAEREKVGKIWESIKPYVL